MAQQDVNTTVSPKINLSVRDSLYLVLGLNEQGETVVSKDRRGEDVALDYSDTTKWYAVERAWAFEQKPEVHHVLILEWDKEFGKYVPSIGDNTSNAMADLRKRHPSKDGKSAIPGIVELNGLSTIAKEASAHAKKNAGKVTPEHIATMARNFYQGMKALGVTRDQQLSLIRQYAPELIGQPKPTSVTEHAPARTPQGAEVK